MKLFASKLGLSGSIIPSALYLKVKIHLHSIVLFFQRTRNKLPNIIFLSKAFISPTVSSFHFGSLTVYLQSKRIRRRSRRQRNSIRRGQRFIRDKIRYKMSTATPNYSLIVTRISKSWIVGSSSFESGILLWSGGVESKNIS